MRTVGSIAVGSGETGDQGTYADAGRELGACEMMFLLFLSCSSSLPHH